MITRRGLIGALVTGPAIVRCSSLMKMPRVPYGVRTSVLIDNTRPVRFYKYLVQVESGPVRQFYINLADDLKKGDRWIKDFSMPVMTVMENLGPSRPHDGTGLITLSYREHGAP